MEYGITRQLNMVFDDAVQKTRDALAEEGFGVLTEIDVKATLKKKLNVTYDNYIILGACNPSLAYRALQAEKQVGLLLPCNIIIYEDSGKVSVSAIKPKTAMGMIDNAELQNVAEKAEKKLINVVNSLE